MRDDQIMDLWLWVLNLYRMNLENSNCTACQATSKSTNVAPCGPLEALILTGAKALEDKGEEYAIAVPGSLSN